MPLDRPKIDKPQGDIPFDLGVEDIVVGDGEEATKGKRGGRETRCLSRATKVALGQEGCLVVVV